jgi:hypothetical protein
MEAKVAQPCFCYRIAPRRIGNFPTDKLATIGKAKSRVLPKLLFQHHFRVMVQRYIRGVPFLFDSAKPYSCPSQHDSTPIRLSLVPDNLLPSQSGLKRPDEEGKPTTTDRPLPALPIANFLRSCSGADITFDYQSH